MSQMPTSLISVIEKNLYEMLIYLPEQLGHTIIRTPEATLVKCVIDAYSFNTVCWTHCESDRVNDVFKMIKKEFEDRSFFWWVGPNSRPEDLTKRLESNKLVKTGHEQVLVCDLAQMNQKPSSRYLKIECVNSTQQMKTFAQTLEENDKSSSIFYKSACVLPYPANYPCKFYVAYLYGQPVGIGSLFVTEDIVGIFDIVTLKRHRNRGFGSTMTLHLMNEVKRMGYSHVYLSTTNEDALRIYRRLNFEPLTAFECFRWRKYG